MPTPRKKYPHNFIYEDGAYMTFELTSDEHTYVKEAMTTGKVVMLTSNAIINTKGLRFVVELKEKESEAVTHTLDADPIVDKEVREYLEFIRQGE